MTPTEAIDDLIARHQVWRGATLATLRKTILEVVQRQLGASKEQVGAGKGGL